MNKKIYIPIAALAAMAALTGCDENAWNDHLDGFESDGWVVLVLEHVAGAHPAQPWRRDEFLAVVDAVLDLADRLTPSPLELGSAVDELREGWQGWARCSANPLPDLDPWLADRLPGLNDRARRSLDAMVGDTLLHLDLRADNLLIRSAEGPIAERVVLIECDLRRPDFAPALIAQITEPR